MTFGTPYLDLYQSFGFAQKKKPEVGARHTAAEDYFLEVFTMRDDGHDIVVCGHRRECDFLEEGRSRNDFLYTFAGVGKD